MERGCLPTTCKYDFFPFFPPTNYGLKHILPNKNKNKNKKHFKLFFPKIYFLTSSNKCLNS